MKKLRIVIAIFLTYGSLFSQTKDKEFFIRTVAFYNLENLFDTINQIDKRDELSPIMELKSGKSEVYFDKLEKLSYVISQIGKEKSKLPPSIIGVAEIENRNVLEDLISTKPLKKYKYQIVHFDSPDIRGIDVGLLYNSNLFQLIHQEAIPLRIYKDNRRVYTRDILWVSGYLDGELIHVLVNHWPSRRGGEQATNYLRERAAFEVKITINRILQDDENSKIIVMGDFNDNPNNSSFKKVLETQKRKQKTDKNYLFNPYELMFLKGHSTLGNRDKIHLFDQLLLSSSLIKMKGETYNSYKLYKANIFNPSYLITSEGKYKGYPFRSFSNGKYTGGYSDHFPVYLYLLKEKNN